MPVSIATEAGDAPPIEPVPRRPAADPTRLSLLAATAEADEVSHADRARAHPDLERLRVNLAATAVLLAQVTPAAEAFVVADHAGIPFLRTGVRLPLEASTSITAAAVGRQQPLPPRYHRAPIESLMSAAGLESVLCASLHRPCGAVLAAWPDDSAQATDFGAVVDQHSTELAQLLTEGRVRSPRTVLVCHEDPVLGGGLARLVEQGLRTSVEVTSTLEAAVERLQEFPAALIVCSDRLSTDSEFPDVARRFRAAGSAAPLLVVSRGGGGNALQGAVIAGAAGFLALPEVEERLVESASTLLDGRSDLPADELGAGPQLTVREHQVLKGVDRGLADKEIAGELDIATSTVKTHARAIYAKLSVTSRTAAVHRARNLGLI